MSTMMGPTLAADPIVQSIYIGLLFLELHSFPMTITPIKITITTPVNIITITPINTVACINSL